MNLFGRVFRKSKLKADNTVTTTCKDPVRRNKIDEFPCEDIQRKPFDEEETLSKLQELRENIFNTKSEQSDTESKTKEEEKADEEYDFDSVLDELENEFSFDDVDVVDLDNLGGLDDLDDLSLDTADSKDTEVKTNNRKKDFKLKPTILSEILESLSVGSKLPSDSEETIDDVVIRMGKLEETLEDNTIKELKNKLENDYTNAETLLEDNDYDSIIPVRREIHEGFEVIETQINRLKRIFKSKPYPPLHVIRYYVKKLVNALPFDEYSKEESKTDISMNHYLVSAEINQRHFEQLDNDLCEMEYVKRRVEGFKISPTGHSFRSQILGLNFQKRLLLQLVKEKASMLQRHAFEDTHITFQESELTSKQKNIIGRFRKTHKSINTDKEWFDIFSLELAEKPDHYKLTHWYKDIDGVGDVSAEFIENYIQDNYPDSASAFVISLIWLLREERSKRNAWEPNYDQDGIHDIWLLFKETMQKQGKL